MKRSYIPLVVLTFILLISSGCATNRGILDVRVPLPENSSSDLNVKIVRVTDLRQFELTPDKPSIPSLKNGEIEDKSITERAIARKRNGYGKALGDILLPEGRTVEDLVREASIKSFRESGYNVVSEEDPAYSSATPVEIDIDEFWSWITPGFWAIKMEFISSLRFHTDIEALKDNKEVKGYVLLHTQAAGTRAWQNTINKGIDDLVQKIKNRLGGSDAGGTDQNLL